MIWSPWVNNLRFCICFASTKCSKNATLLCHGCSTCSSRVECTVHCCLEHLLQCFQLLFVKRAWSYRIMGFSGSNIPSASANILGRTIRTLESVGFPCIFQQVSLVCPVLLQWSHHGRLFFFWKVFCDPQVALDWGTRAANAEFSAWEGSFMDPSLTFLRYSSLWTSKNTSWTLGSSFMLRILPWTSSRSRFGRSRNL